MPDMGKFRTVTRRCKLESCTGSNGRNIYRYDKEISSSEILSEIPKVGTQANEL